MAVNLLDELPVELEAEIFSYLDLTSLRKIRLTSRHSHEVSLPAFKSAFRTVEATFTDSGLQRLNEISRDQDLAKSVEHVRIVLPGTCPRVSSTDTGSTQEEKNEDEETNEEVNERKTSLLSQAISRFHNCYSIGTEPMENFRDQKLGHLSVNETKSASWNLDAIQQAFDRCGRPLQELKTGLGFRICVLDAKCLAQSTRVNLRHLHIERGLASGPGGALLPAYHDFISLGYLNLQGVSDKDVIYLSTRKGFPALKELEIRAGDGYAHLTYLPGIITRQPVLQILRISLMNQSAESCASFAEFSRTYKQLQEFRLKFDEIVDPTGEILPPIEFDCTKAGNLDLLAKFSRGDRALDFAVARAEFFASFNFDSILHNTGDNAGLFGNTNFMSTFGKIKIEARAE